MTQRDPNEYQREYLVSVGDRPWGYYVVLANELDVKVKKITVFPQHRLSLQRHSRREEHWFIQRGIATITIEDKDHILGAGDSIDIPRGTKHRIANSRNENLIFIEIQTGDYFGEDDIERFEDDYIGKR
jgi:mannose-6-phosphate isomerase-like protein (cupin superfamily)